jgi:hypothetical protein
MTLRFCSTVAILVASTAFAAAQSPTRLGAFRDWSAYTYTDGGNKVCYVASTPTDTAPKGVNRDPIYFMISIRPADQVQHEASVIIGYPIKENSTVTATVDGQDFTLFTKDDGAWVQNPQDEASLVAAMQKGRTLVIKGTSRRGTDTTDTYSLSGVTAALESAGKECR